MDKRMYGMQAIRIAQRAGNADFQAAFSNMAGRVVLTSGKMYVSDLKQLTLWMTDRGLMPQSLPHNELIVYRAHQREAYAKATALWAVTQRLLDEIIQCQMLERPEKSIHSFRAGNDDSHDRALKRKEMRALPDALERIYIR